MMRSIIAATAVAASTAQAFEMDAMKHDVQEINGKNFDKVISTNRDSGVSAVWYFSASSRADEAFLDKYNEIAKKAKGMVRVTAINCDRKDNKKQCERDGVQATPHVHIYPKNPQPQYKYEGELTTDALTKKLFKHIPNNVKKLKDVAEYKAMLKKDPTKPKIILFSDKKSPAVIFKALSSEVVFHRTAQFGFVSTADEEGKALLKEATRGKARKLPAVLLVNSGRNKKEWFKAKKPEDMSFAKLHEWINLYSESGMGDTLKASTGGGAEAEEVEVERLRELTGKSSRDVCFGQKAVCAIYAKEGPIEEKEIDQILSYEERFTSKSDRGIKYTWAWLDLSVEKDFKKTLEDMEVKLADKEGRDAETLTYPTMLFVKPPKKKREEKLLSYIKIENGKDAMNVSEVENMVDKIAGGASYARASLPSFANRPKKAKADKKTEL